MTRKIIAAALALLAAFSLTCCGGGKEEYGTIESIEVPPAEGTQTQDAAYGDTDNPFPDYSYGTLEMGSAKFSLSVPENWFTLAYNPGCLRFDIPDSDPYFPGSTCYVQCLFDYDASPDGLDQFRHLAAEFSKPMSPYITGLPYMYQGKDIYIRRYEAASKVSTPSLVDDDALACTKVTRDVTLIDRGTADVVSFEGMDLVATYFKWESFPVMISILVPHDRSNDAEKLTEYMLSCTKRISQKTSSLAEFHAGEISFTLPSEFKTVNDSGNILISGPASVDCTSGISVGIFKLNDDPDSITSDAFDDTYTDLLASALIDPSSAGEYTVLASYGETESAKLHDEIKSFTGDMTMLPYEDNYLHARNAYGMGCTWYTNCYIVERNKAFFMIADLYPPQDKDLAASIETTLLKSLTYGGK